MSPYPKTLFEHVENIMGDALNSAEKSIAEGNLDPAGAEKLRVEKRMDGLAEAIRAIARQLDHREAKQTPRGNGG